MADVARMNAIREQTVQHRDKSAITVESLTILHQSVGSPNRKAARQKHRNTIKARNQNTGLGK